MTTSANKTYVAMRIALHADWFAHTATPVCVYCLETMGVLGMTETPPAEIGVAGQYHVRFGGTDYIAVPSNWRTYAGKSAWYTLIGTA